MGTKSVLFLYTDGGPDHRKTYISTQLSLIALFLNLNLDYLCAARTAPHNSWRNPVERMMPIFNLGFQRIGLMRSEMSEPAEAAWRIATALHFSEKQLGEPFKNEIAKSLESMISLLSDVISRLQLKGEKFQVYDNSSSEDIHNFWVVLQLIEPLLTRNDTRKKDIADKDGLKAFYEHYCCSRHYFFRSKSVGKSNVRYVSLLRC